MAAGYVSIILHGHLPYVRHPEYDEFFEERWLFEAITECYLPLLKACDRLVDEGIKFRLAFSLSPTLITMLQDKLLQQRYLNHMAKLVELSYREVKRTEDDARFHGLACMYREWLLDSVRQFDVQYRRDLVSAFKRLMEAGVLELMTCTATHGFLPLLKTNPGVVRAQVQIGAEMYRKTFATDPAGIWVPECAYYPGLENVLREAGFKFFIVDSHGILNASVRPHYGLFAPVACANGVAAFGRDPESSRQVWSSHEGYPGDFDYRDFYKDIGFELDFDYIKPYILDGKTRILTGLKYWRVTGSEHKEPYDPAKAREKARLHAKHFVDCRQQQVDHHAARMDRPPMVISPYDAELYGHWWFEGPQFIEFVIREIAGRDSGLELATPSDYLERHPVLQRSTPSASSWGWHGYNDCWLSGCNEWIYPHLHRAAREMNALATTYAKVGAGSLADRALNQAARSLLLAQASDWPFLMKTGTASEYANRRIRDQLARFHYLAAAVRKGEIDLKRLQALESMDAIFPFIDFRIYAEPQRSAAVDLSRETA
jgi:1,4-alpha-glucan branching enzyme